MFEANPLRGPIYYGSAEPSFTKLYYFSVVCRALAHFYSLTAAWEMIQFTTQKYQKEFVSLPTQQFCLQISVQLFHNLISKLYLNSVNFNMNTRTDIQNMIHLIKNSFEQLLNANTCYGLLNYNYH